MQAIKAFQNTATEWSIKFRVTPDTGATANPHRIDHLTCKGFLYFRRFKLGVDAESGWHVADWSEDPEHPDGAPTPRLGCNPINASLYIHHRNRMIASRRGGV